MVPQMNKGNIDPSASTPQKISILSPSIDDGSNLSIFTTSVAQDKMNPKEKGDNRDQE